MRVIFLDIDGVLNGHERDATAQSTTIKPRQASRLNRIIEQTDPKIVVSSAWRYLVLKGAMTLMGLQHLLQSHHLHVVGRLIDVTCSDESIADRGGQIRAWLARSSEVEQWVVLDDMDSLDVDLGGDQWRHVKTAPSLGLSDANVEQAIRILQGGGR